MASQLAARGDVSVRTLAGRLGHADASLTMKVYAAFFPAADAEAADHMGRLLGPAADKETTPSEKGVVGPGELPLAGFSRILPG